ncbi:MAG: TIGR00159 family protein [Acidobacteria bacterium]|nr:TIGR00159 family protein [Acidobacteriota bacterium]
MEGSMGGGQLSRVGWWDVVDVCIVAWLFYQLLKLVRRSHAIQIFTGGGLLVTLYYASQFMPLQTLNWLIRDLFGYLVFAAIVLFQGDIRRALAHFGRAPFFALWGRSRATSESIEEVLEALRMLADQGVGAIVAIERGMGLRNYVESGIPLDAEVSYDLLVSVFRPGSPLHDGAVVLQSNRLAAAACFLPLSVNVRISKNLGTRHRAAIGLTEETDAVALVVSEETGQLSLVVDGQIEQALELEQLRGRLETLILGSRYTLGREQTAGELG